MSEYKDGRGDYYLAEGLREERSVRSIPQDSADGLLRLLTRAYMRGHSHGRNSRHDIIEAHPRHHRQHHCCQVGAAGRPRHPGKGASEASELTAKLIKRVVA